MLGLVYFVKIQEYSKNNNLSKIFCQAICKSYILFGLPFRGCFAVFVLLPLFLVLILLAASFLEPVLSISHFQKKKRKKSVQIT